MTARGLNRREWLAGSALAGLFGLARPALGTTPDTPAPALPWRNWSGGVVAHPAGRFAPASEGELVEFLSTTSGPLRPVGSGHSFTPLVPTDGHLVVIDRLAGILDHDAESLQATMGGGARIGDLGAPLEALGQAMINLPDIDRQTLAGATATATHGTGIAHQSLSGYITGLRIVTADGGVLDVDAETDPDTFHAARVSLGALGVVTRIRMQNRAPYRLRVRSWAQTTESVLETFDASAARHRHFEMFPLVHSDYALVLAIDETDEPVRNPPPAPEEEDGFGAAMAGWMGLPPGERRPHINAAASQIESSEVIDTSHKALTNVRNSRFNEMEYSVPLHAGAECLREVLRTIAEREIDVVFPLEYRYVARDDTWLGMSSGAEDHAAISIHRTATEDYRPYFDAIEPIFRKYGGRPHWGKVHSLGHAELSALYPRFEDFRALRRRLDPGGRFLNAHLRRLFGEPTDGGAA